MSVGVGHNVNGDLDLCDLKSPSSQESGLGTMLAIDDSLGSLEELSEGVQLQLNTHMDHTRLLQYELDLLRAQLAEKNRLISSQQISIKKLQDALNASQRELNDFRRIAETELTCRTETINILQSDLADCQQQYAECFQQVVNQDRVISELRDDDAILVQKVTYLESQLNKSGRDASTQTNGYIQPPLYGQRMVDSSSTNLSKSANFHHPTPTFFRTEGSRTDRSTRRNVHSMIELPRNACKSPSPTSFRSPTGNRADQSSKSEDKFVTVEMFQDLLAEIRLLQLQGRPASVPPPPPPAPQYQQQNNRNLPAATRSDETIELWNSITDEKQHRLQLEHSIRLLEIDMMDVRNQVQNCNARISSQQTNKCQGFTCSSKTCCSPAPATNCCSCAVAGATTLYTLV